MLPSVRRKILRDGVEDVALFEAVKARYGKKIAAMLKLTPDVFVHPHYYDNLPETLPFRRGAILRRFAK